MPTGRHDTGYRPPASPSPTYHHGSRGDRHAPESKEQYEMSQRVPSDSALHSTDQFFQAVSYSIDIKDNFNYWIIG